MLTSDLLYISQFEIVRTWIDRLSGAELATPSVLPHWTVRDLVAHLTATGHSIAALEPHDPQPSGDPADEPLGVGAYLRQYAASAEAIDTGTRDLAAAAGDDLFALLDESDAAARRRLAELGGADQLVRARRGTIMLSDFLDTRVLELVVHADDLSRSLPDQQPLHVLPSAINRMVRVLREVITDRAADPTAILSAASVLPPADFVLIAAGRRPAPGELPGPVLDALRVL